ncbi:hypothetical protein AVEN_255142-1 [Araneus ventricosus]|uniref:RNase H type-1 domain-containing protein n=1 Tax=Araneus ventricosus TaxID=182803 RepID=A0A4Y2BC96_ARAVE|nr:hypothetical protein AVEN_255142-1 [Araneus ventricosus]
METETKIQKDTLPNNYEEDAYEASAWALSVSPRLEKKLASIQKIFLLCITGSYRTTALQTITRIMPLHLKAQEEAEPYKEDNNLMFFTDGSKTEMGTGCSYCAFENGVKVLEWMGKLEKFHTLFQAELMGLKEAIIRESQGNEITKIWIDGLSSAMAVLDPHTPHQLI